MITTKVLMRVFILSMLSVFTFDVFAQEDNHNLITSNTECAKNMAWLVSKEGDVVWRPRHANGWTAAEVGQVFCAGDSVRVDALRATLQLTNATLVRLRQGALVKFAQEQPSFVMQLLQGAAYFISRTPEVFHIEMPYINAAIEGTEFLLEHTETRDSISVFEGRVSAGAVNDNDPSALGMNDRNVHTNLHAVAGEKITAFANGNNKPPQLSRDITLRDTARWTLYFPPLLDLHNLPDDIIASLYRGEFAQVYRKTSKMEAIASSDYSESNVVSQNKNDMALFSLRVSLAFYLGDYDTAALLMPELLRRDPEAHAALSVIQSLVLNEAERALAQAQQLTQQNNINQTSSKNPMAFLSLSYALQAQQQLPQAYDAARYAAQLSRNNPFVLAREAELAISLNELDEAEIAIERMLSMSPDFSRVHVFNGVLALNKNKYIDAEKYFTRALKIHNADPLAHFFLGLTAIRLQQLERGRSELELAVLLDPSNSVYRSYLGKAYSAERREVEAMKQFDLALELDPNDPTHWLYRSILLGSEKKYYEAYEALEQSIARNDNRAVFRSRLALDSDGAVRGANLAEIYRAIGWDDQASVVAAESIAQAPADYSGHKLLAESLFASPRQEAAAASEIFQAQLRQPITARPLRSLQSEQDLFVVAGLAPHQIGLHELSPMFTRGGMDAQFSLAAGGNNTRLTDVYVSGLYGNTAIAAEYFDYSTDGFKRDYGRTYQLANVYGQTQFTSQLNGFLELRSRNEERGVLVGNIATKNSEIFESMTNTIRLGLRYTPSLSSTWFYAFDHIADDTQKIARNVISDNGPILANEFTTDDDVVDVEFQNIRNFTGGNVIFGGDYAAIDRFQRTVDKVTNVPVTVEPRLNATRHDIEYNNTYAYVHSNYTDAIGFSAGVSHVEFSAAELITSNDKLWNAKLGFTFALNNKLDLSLAYFENLKRPLEISQSLEPTHIQGFNQVFDDAGFVYSESTAIALRLRINNAWRWHNEAYSRHLDWSRSIDKAMSYRRSDIEEQVVNSGVYWLGQHFSYYLKANREEQKFTNGRISSNLPEKLVTQRIENKISVFLGDQLSMSMGINNVLQRSIFSLSLTDRHEYVERFWLVKAELKYLFHRDKYSVTLRVENLTNQYFTYQDKNILDGSARSFGYIPERTGLLRFSASW